jgi:exopolyphosphatase / guanosine-5'-triphosphate,3'-diphosphate pyrophosphatase
MAAAATIDIGTNSLLLLIGEPLPDGSIRVLEDRAHITRLGEGLAASDRLTDAAIERTIATLREYKECCDRHGAQAVAAVGTAALRQASNAEAFLARARDELGIAVDVIAPEREARLTHLAAVRDFGEEIVVIDIGGGSTEFIARALPHHGVAGELALKSLPIGCVTLTERFIASDPPAPAEVQALRMAVREALEATVELDHFARPHDHMLVATAGTATTLMAMHLALPAYQPELVHGQHLKITDLRALVAALVAATLDERRRMPGLLPARADVILAGAVLLHEAMNELGYADVTISDRGVKWGLFYEKFCT